MKCIIYFMLLVLFVSAEEIKKDKNEPCDPTIVLFLLPFCIIAVKGCMDSNIMSELLDC